MLIRILRSHVENTASYYSGQVIDLPSNEARKKIDDGFAVPVKDTPEIPERSTQAKRETR
jgi:hypothetical protein